MDKVYSIVTIVFALCLLLYAGILFILKDVDLIPKSYMAKISDKKLYAKMFAILIALISMAPLLSGIIALFGKIEIMIIPALIVLIGGIIAAIIIGVKIMPKEL